MSENYPSVAGTGLIDFAKAITARTLLGMSGMASVPLTVASPFIPAPLAAKIGVTALGIGCFFWAAYAAWRDERARVINLQARLAGQGKLEIDHVSGRRRFDETGQGLHSPTRTLSVRISNVGGKPVRDCKLYFVSIEPNDERLAGDIMMRVFQEAALNPGDERYLQLVTYGEADGRLKGDTIAKLHVPYTPTSDLGDERVIGTGTPYVVTLRATGDGSEACTRQFRIWTSEGSLNMAPESQ